MSNSSTLPAKDIEGRKFAPIALFGGVDQETSKFVVNPSTLYDSLNYTSSTRGYQRAQGLFHFDGTIDSGVTNMWLVAVDDNDASLIGSRFTLGGEVTWATESTGVVVYFSRVAAATDYTMLGIVEILGDEPAAGHTFTDTETGTTLALNGSVTYDPSELVSARNPDTGAYIADTVTKYLDFLNNDANAALTSQTTTGSSGYHGMVPGVGRISGGWQYEDSVYMIRDGYAIDFVFGVTEFKPGEEVIIDLVSGTEQVMVAYVEHTGGYWSSGTATGKLVVMPSTNTSDYTSLDNISTTSAKIRDTGSTSMANIDSTDTQYGGLIWRGTIAGWEWVDAGWTIDYDTGNNAPNVKAAPLFLDDLITATRSTGATAVAAGTQAGSAPYVVWVNPGNITADDGTNATCNLASGELSQYIKAEIPAGILPQEDVRIVGIEVIINAEFTGANAPIDSAVRIVNEVSGANFYQSANRARLEFLTGADADYTYGSSVDTWGVTDISAADVNSGDMHVLVQYWNSSAGSGQAEIDSVTVNISYVPNNEKVWFWDGASDVSEGVINAYQIDSGDFGAGNDAAGNMSFTSLTAPEAIGVGMEMYSESSAGGLPIGVVTSIPSYNLLPSSDLMKSEGSQYQVIQANYYENDESEAVYGVTGAGPGFSYDGTSFSYLRAPLARSVDKPRHIAFHDNRLALGYSSGHVILSAIGVPNDFSAIDSASSWGVGDRVTGLISLAGNVLGVFSEASIRSLEGSDSASGTMRTISSTTGCREYTLQNITGPYFADNRGISSLTTSDRYGDFDMGRISDLIRTWVQERMQEKRTTQTIDTSPVASVAIRSKNEYRLYFKDGYSMVVYFRANGKVESTFMHYDTANYGTDYVPTFINSHILSTGRERIVMGTENGSVWVVDGANVIQGISSAIKPDCWFINNPINFGRPEAVHKHYHVVLQGQFFGAQSVDSWSDGNYIFDETGPAHDSIVLGDYGDAPLFESRSEVDSTYLPSLTDGFTMKVKTSMDGSRPHTFQSLLFRASSKGVDRNRTPKTY